MVVDFLCMNIVSERKRLHDGFGLTCSQKYKINKPRKEFIEGLEKKLLKLLKEKYEKNIS